MKQERTSEVLSDREVVHVAEVPEIPNHSNYTFGERIFDRIMGIRKSIRDSQPDWYKVLHGL